MNFYSVIEKIWVEYEDVVNRPKFNFKARGKFIDAKDFDEELSDPKIKFFTAFR